jgi:hypothetical protein
VLDLYQTKNEMTTSLNLPELNPENKTYKTGALIKQHAGQSTSTMQSTHPAE